MNNTGLKIFYFFLITEKRSLQLSLLDFFFFFELYKFDLGCTIDNK